MTAVTGDKVHAAFGRNLTTARWLRGWTLRQAALKAGLSWMTLHRAENGREITLTTALKAAAAYGVTLDQLTREPTP